MSENVIQASFAGGELSPSLFARVDVQKYHSGAARMRNFFVDYRSGASTRPGTEYIRPTVQGQGPVRLIRFQQSVDVTFILEFGNHYLRFIANGGSVVANDGTLISAVNTGTSTMLIAQGNDVAVNDLAFIADTAYSQLNGRHVLVQSVAGNKVSIVDPFFGAPIDSTGWGPTGSGGGTIQKVYTITTPYGSDELALLKFSQKASIMNITHPNHPPYRLQLISANNWTLTPDVFGSTATKPTFVSGIASSTGTANYVYKVSAVDVNGQESAPSDPIAVNGAHDMRVIDSTSGTSGSIQISWTAVAGAQSYNVYRSSPTIGAAGPLDQSVGFIGSTTTLSLTDANIAADFQIQPPVHQNPFASENPAVSSYFQQRLFFANGGGNDLDRFWASKPGADLNFDISIPSQADDAIDAELVSLEVNEIKSMIPMPSGLVMLTTKGAWQVSGGAGGVATQGGPITPTTLTATAQAYVGANDVPPILINYDIVYVQQKGSIVRDLSYNIYANIYSGNDISIMSNHLFYGHTISEWAYAEEPFKIIWAVRDDGILLSLTLIKEQDMYGWAQHDTFGYFRSVATVTEGTVDATYFVVERPYPIAGPFSTVLTVERLHEREFEFGAEDAWSVDNAVATPTNNPPATARIITDASNNAVIEANDTVFNNQMLGWTVRVGGGKIIITQIRSPTVVGGEVVQAITDMIPNDPNGQPAIASAGDWSVDPPLRVVHGLSHLEGQQVSILADGGVVSGMTVVDGTVTLPQPASKIVIGYGYQAQLQTMPLDVGNEMNTIQGKRKKVAALTVRAKDSRGLKAGRTFKHLVPIKEMNRTTHMGYQQPLITGDERIIMDPLWDVPGQICLQLDDPLPATVLGVIPEVVIGDSAK